MNWVKETVKSVAKTFLAIRCETCHADLPSRAWLKNHMGHDVVYVNLDGSIDR